MRKHERIERFRVVVLEKRTESIVDGEKDKHMDHREHQTGCFPSHAIMAHRLEFFDGAYVTKMYVYVSLGLDKSC